MKNELARALDASADREVVLERLARERFDVLVIGGGITGAAIAHAATRADLRVAIIDKRDFAAGTSSRSSRLIHGGLRYLKQGHVRLVWRSQREQQSLAQSAPHLVRPMPMILPLYPYRHSPNIFAIGSATLVYRALQPREAYARHGWMCARSLLDKEPLLDPKGLLGGFVCHEYLTHDARLVWETVLAATEAGGCAANYVRVLSLLNSRGRVCGAALRDELTGTMIEARARFVVNAAGPWSDELPTNPGPKRLHLSKGTHIFLQRNRLPLQQAIVLFSPRDARPMAAIPAANFVLVGPTETEFCGEADRVKPDREDICYLLETLNEFFRGMRLRETDVIAARAGLRPLYNRKPKAAGCVSREYHIEWQREGLLSVLGGKLTLHRQAAREVVRFLSREFRISPLSVHGTAPRLPGAVWPIEASAIFDKLRRAGVTDQSAAHLIRSYGGRAALFDDLISEDPELRNRITPALPHLKAEAVFSRRHEMAVCAEDFIERRTDLALCAKAAKVEPVSLVSRVWRPEVAGAACGA